MAPTLGALLRACRTSAKLSQDALATCIEKRNRFPAYSQTSKSKVLAEVIHIEQSDTCTFTGEELRIFWRNALKCLQNADAVTLALLAVLLAHVVPDP